MRGLRGWIVALALAVLIAAAAYLVQPHQDSPEHSSSSDAANGASAALLFAASIGHPTQQVAGTYALPTGTAMLFVFTPTSAFTSDEAGSTADWVRSGGVLVYASEQGDTELDRALSVSRISGFVSGNPATANPALDGVTTVSGGNLVSPLTPGPQQVPVLRSADGYPVAYIEKFGAGSIVVLSDPLELCNGYLDKTDNGRFLADLLGLVPADAVVAFDEYHHGLVLSDFAPQAWVLTPWGAGLLWLLVAVFIGLVLRGRGFGPLIPRPADIPRADAEWAVAVGELLRRSGGRAVTLGMLASASERAVAARTGLPAYPRERFWNALYTRAPGLAAELADAEHALYGSVGGDAELLSAAQRLHRIAYPVAPERRRRQPIKEEAR